MSGPLDPMPDRGTAMLQRLSPWEADDPSVIAIMRAGADELDAISDMMEAVRLQAWPHMADDTYGLLVIHERMLGLPQAPRGVPLEARQAAVKAAIQSRKVGSKAEWYRRMTTLMRGAPFTYEENAPAPGWVTLTVPFASGSYNSAQVAAFARKITQSHIEILLAYSEGWLVGVSPIGDAL